MAGIALVPGPVEVLSHFSELYEEVAREVLGANFSPFFAPQAKEGGLIVAHDDSSIRATDEAAAVWCVNSHVFIFLELFLPDGRNRTCVTFYDIWHHMGQDKKSSLRGYQIRAARALVGWSADDLSRESAVSMRTIRRAELSEYETSMTSANELSIRRALEAAGVEFIDENGGGPGVRLRKRHRPKR